MLSEGSAERILQDRRYLHLHPELSGLEENTLAMIRKRLAELGIPYLEVEKGGILGFIHGDHEGDPKNSKTILLRADVDALEVTEDPCNLTGKKAVCSPLPNAAHLCGHDAHTAILLETARVLQKNRRLLKGTVILCFERAEENGGPDGSYGVGRLLNALEERHLKPEKCAALHVYPDLPSGIFSIRPGPALAGNVGFRVRIHGKGGHASRPDLVNHPLDCFTAFYSAMKQFPARHLGPFNAMTLAIPMVQCGSAANIIPETLRFSGMARAFDVHALEQFREVFLLNLDTICRTYGCTYEIEQLYLEKPLINDPETALQLRRIVETKLGPEHYREEPPAFVSESFAYFTQKYPGVMIFLGIRNEEKGSGAPLHAPQFDLDEEALPSGAQLFTEYVMQVLGDS